MSRTLAAVGELRADLLEVLDGVDDLSVLCAAPGLLPGPFRGQEQLAIDPGASLSLDTSFAWRRAMIEFFSASIDRLPQTLDWEQRILRRIDQLARGDWTVQQVMHRADHTRLLVGPTCAQVFFGPLTSAGAREVQGLRLELTGEAHARARAWLQGELDQADDISGLVRQALDESWAAAPISPEDLYYKVLYDYFGATLAALDREVDDNPLLDVLTDFQQEAYQYAKGVLRRYGGVFLADVVGLGKTFIALALLKHLRRRYGHRAVVIAPPAVAPTWEELAREHGLDLVTVSIGRLADLARYDSYDVLVLDESHHFRNTGTQRYETLQRWLRPNGEPSARQVLLLSATPQNNDANDVLNQLKLFPDNYTRLPYRGESLDAWFQTVRGGAEDLRDLLQHVVVRRTRAFIAAAYPNATLRRALGNGATERVPLRFPRRVSGEAQTLRYELDTGEQGGGLYDRVLETLASMRYPLHALGRYVLDEHRAAPELVGLARSAASLRGLYKCLLLKRLESSLAAFRLSLQRLYLRLKEAIVLLAEGQVVVREDDGADEADDRSQEGLPSRVSAACFQVPELRRAIEGDLWALDALLGRVERFHADQDPKLARLRSWLASRPPTQHRTLVFTQFADTATWLFEQLGQSAGRTAVVTGSTGSKLSFVRRFAPRANRATIDPANILDLLICTDALGEGVNLQDGDTLVNYDLHWNPVRLIQRAGRIDRIGSENDEIWIASFLPERRLEARLGLEAVLRRRIDEFLRVFGEDSAVLPSDEQPDVEKMSSAYTGRALTEADATDDLDGLSRHINRVLTLRREEPARFDRVVRLRPGRRAWSREGGAGVVACRLGWYWNFWTVKGRDLSLVPDQDALDRLYEHARTGEGEPRLDRDIGAIAEAARAEFAPRAAAFRQQRAHPRLSGPEAFTLDGLARYRQACTLTQRPLVEAMEAWVRAGTARPVLIREARGWMNQRLAPQAMFHEVSVLFRRFPPQEEVLGESELVGLVLASGG